MAKIKVSKSRLLEAIKSTGGKTTGICDLLGITRPTLSRYVEADPNIAEAIEYAQTRIVDRAEFKLAEAIERGESWAITLILKDHKRGKERGYGNSLDVTSAGQALGPVIVNVGIDATKL
jgi:predicted transcriptional regulator